MFIMDNDIIEVTVYFRKSGHRYLAYTEKDFDKEITKEEDKKKYSKLAVKLYELNWGLYNQLQEEAMVDNGQGDRHFSFKIYKENRLKKLIKEWDALKDGKPIPINEKSIGMLSPSVAEAILRAYDEITLLGEDEEGKS